MKKEEETPVVPANRNETNFVPPLHGFQFQGSREMGSGEIRHYLVKVTVAGNLTAYVWAEDGSPVMENRLPLVLKRARINSIPSAVSSLKLSEETEKLDSKEFRDREISYLKSVSLPGLGELTKLNLTEVELSKLSDLTLAYTKVSQRSASIFSAQVRAEIKSRV